MFCRAAVPAIALSMLHVSPAPAQPPPIDVAPVLVVPAEHSSYADRAARLLATLARDNWITPLRPALGTGDVEHCADVKDWSSCAASVIAGRVEFPGTIAVFVDHPGWQSAAVRMRCVGSDSKKASEVRVHLEDALIDGGKIALGERRDAASCVIGALHGAVRD